MQAKKFFSCEFGKIFNQTCVGLVVVVSSLIIGGVFWYSNIYVSPNLLSNASSMAREIIGESVKCTDENTRLILNTEAFSVLEEAIETCKESIFIRMFIWRGDETGVNLVSNLLEAADRGVKITLIKDKFGFAFETSEENGVSMFHTHQSFQNRVAEWTIRKLYPHNYCPSDNSTLFPAFLKARGRFLEHPNVHVQRNEDLLDHSKVWIFDNRVVFIGGINVEEKENSVDCARREYVDYMVRVSDPKFAKFYYRLNSAEFRRNQSIFDSHAKNDDDEEGSCEIVMNKNYVQRGLVARTKFRVYEIEDRIISLFEAAEDEILIEMAYLGNWKILNTLQKKINEGVDVKFYVSRTSNLRDDLNKRILFDFYSKNKKKRIRSIERSKRKGEEAVVGEVKIYLTEKMVHAKSFSVDSGKVLWIGSANFIGGISRSVQETCVYFTNVQQAAPEMYRQYKDHLREMQLAAVEVTDENVDEVLLYNRFVAGFEEISLEFGSWIRRFIRYF